VSIADDLACQQLVELVTEYLEGSLPPAERARFEVHLAVCASCRAHLEQMQKTIRTVGRVSIDSIPPETKQDLLQAFRDWKRS
jgi:anti-sigma factor RsiW